ncbi:MAG: fibronectin type III domain-containing protein [Phycisphaerae bacterium]|nr:fibronectin type III domain-containing protein [Phycisphaerae bacterium]
MATFPQKEADIVALALNMVSGFTDNTAIYPDPIVSVVNLSLSVADYNIKKSAVSAAEAAYTAAVADKDAALELMTDNMHKDINYAVNLVGNDATKLQLIGWDGRKPKTPLALPGQALELTAPDEGEGTIKLCWKAPADGGAVAAYNIQRRQRPEGPWQQVSMAMTNEINLIDQPRAIEWEYRIIAVNKTGAGMPSNTIMAVL